MRPHIRAARKEVLHALRSWIDDRIEEIEREEKSEQKSRSEIKVE
jgi:hypothetical protein